MFLKVCKEEVLVAGGLTETSIISSCSYFENRKYCCCFFLDMSLTTQDIHVHQGGSENMEGTHISLVEWLWWSELWTPRRSTWCPSPTSPEAWREGRAGTQRRHQISAPHVQQRWRRRQRLSVLDHGVDGQTCRQVFRRPGVWQKHRAAWFCRLCVRVADVPEKQKKND